MKFRPAIFGAALAAASLATFDARAAIDEVEIVGGNTVVQHDMGGADTNAAAVSGFSNWAMMISGFAAIGFAGYRRKSTFVAA
jgi:hypothetical protein